MIFSYSQEAKDTIRRLPPEIKRDVKQTLESLRDNPYLGKCLQRELISFISCAFKRYRIIYKVDEVKKQIGIHVVGHRSKV